MPFDKGLTATFNYVFDLSFFEPYSLKPTTSLTLKKVEFLLKTL